MRRLRRPRPGRGRERIHPTRAESVLLRVAAAAIEHPAPSRRLVVPGISHLSATSGRLTLADPAHRITLVILPGQSMPRAAEVPDERYRFDRVEEDGLHHLRVELRPRGADGRSPHRPHPRRQGASDLAGLRLARKSQRMDYYQNGADRLESPMRRKPDGTYEAIDWEPRSARLPRSSRPSRPGTVAKASCITAAAARAITSAAFTPTAR